MVNAEVLPLIIFSPVFGGVLTTLGERAQIIIRFFEGVNEAIMGMVHILIGGQLGVNPLVS
jgi:solute carrier family 1 (high affinity glutamate transporter) protein 1